MREEKIAIVTDSTCDLPVDLMEKYGIEFLPLKIIYRDREYRDRIDITPGEIYDKFDEEIPGTSMPGPEEIKEKFIELKERGFTHILALHISGGLSATCDMSRLAADKLEEVKVEVVDSLRLSMGLGRLVLYAGELIANGEDSFMELVENVRKKIDDIELFFVVKTLRYLKEGGRIGKVKGTLGEFLKIKPIISINEDGEYFTYAHARSRKRSIQKLLDTAREKLGDGHYSIDVMHADAEEEAQGLLSGLKTIENVKDTYFGEISPAMAVHAGPGLIGVCVTKIDD